MINLISTKKKQENYQNFRKDANARAILLQGKAETDKFTAEVDMKELERQISHDRKLRDFMKLKAQERHEDPELVNYRKRKGLIIIEFGIFE
jgi:hypothetical protein